MGAPVTLTRLNTDLPLVTDKKTPDRAFTRFWNAAMSQIEDNLNRVIAAQDAADAAQSDADAAMAAAIAAQAQADAALAAAVAAQATADAAKAIADALDASLNVTAGKVLTVLKTLTLDAGADGAVLNIGTGGTLGSAAFTNASDYLPSGSSGTFLAKANNLSDLASIPTARGNLGLGTAAVANTGVAGATVPLLNGANTWSGTQTFGPIIAASVIGATLTVGTSAANPIILQTDNAESGRLTAGGFFKASPGGAYQNANGTYHEFRSNVAGNPLAILGHSNADPYGFLLTFPGAAPNDAVHYFYYNQDSATVRSVLYTNGGLHNYSANNVNLSDAAVKGALQRYDDKQLDALEASFCKVNWGRFRYLDQTHDDWNHGYTAQGVEEAFAMTAPELVDETDLGTKGEGAKRKGVYETDLAHIAHALLARALKRIEVVENKMYAAGIT